MHGQSLYEDTCIVTLRRSKGPDDAHNWKENANDDAGLLLAYFYNKVFLEARTTTRLAILRTGPILWKILDQAFKYSLNTVICPDVCHGRFGASYITKILELHVDFSLCQVVQAGKEEGEEAKVT